jgi:hypothetical protein
MYQWEAIVCVPGAKTTVAPATGMLHAGLRTPEIAPIGDGTR